MIEEARQFFASSPHVLFFRPLSKESLRRIIVSLLEELVPLRLEVGDEALDFLVEQSYDPTMGARPARRAIQRLLRNPLSLMLARGEIAQGDAVAVSLDDGSLVFARAGSPGKTGAE